MIRRVNVLDQPVADSTLRDAAKFCGLLLGPAPRLDEGAEVGGRVSRLWEVHSEISL